MATKSKRGGARKGAGAKPGVRLAPATRERIRGAMIINRLQKHVEGEAILDATQVSAGLGLLKFQLPTLQATDITSGGAPITVERTVFKKEPT